MSNLKKLETEANISQMFTDLSATASACRLKAHVLLTAFMVQSAITHEIDAMVAEANRLALQWGLCKRKSSARAKQLLSRLDELATQIVAAKARSEIALSTVPQSLADSDPMFLKPKQYPKLVLGVNNVDQLRRN